MLVAIQPQGTKPPFFCIHGLYGTLHSGRALAAAVGPERPFYALIARGFDSSEPPYQTVPEMVRDYYAEIRKVRPAGPYQLGGVCSGGLAALEIALMLSAAGETVAPVLLIDPPPIPFGFYAHYRALDPRDRPDVFRQLYANTQEIMREAALDHGDNTFDAKDPAQLHTATTVGIATLTAFYRHKPPSYTAPVELIACSERVESHRNPDLPWQKILVGPCRVHVVEGDHVKMFRENFGELSVLVKALLDGTLGSGATPADLP